VSGGQTIRVPVSLPVEPKRRSTMEMRTYSSWGRAYAAVRRLRRSIFVRVGNRQAEMVYVPADIRCVPCSQVPPSYSPLKR
jgi:hypothetical protein